MDDQVDIVMAVYNGEKFVKEQIDSILAQDYQNFRLLVRDDHSQDGTLEIIKNYVKAYPNKIFLLPSSGKLGVKGNFSALLEYAKAPYIMLSDQDDIWLKDKVSKSLKKMKELEASKGLDCPLLIHADLKVVDAHLNLIDPSFWKFAHLKPAQSHQLNKLLTQNVVTGCTILINRPLLKLALPIPSETPMHDWWLALVASAFGYIESISEPLILYRQHGKNTLGAKKYGSLKWYKEGIIKLLGNRLEIFPNQEQAKILYERYALLLPGCYKKMVFDYIHLKKYSWLKSRYLILKHRFFKQSFVRNFAAFFLLHS